MCVPLKNVNFSGKEVTPFLDQLNTGMPNDIKITATQKSRYGCNTDGLYSMPQYLSPLNPCPLTEGGWEYNQIHGFKISI